MTWRRRLSRLRPSRNVATLLVATDVAACVAAAIATGLWTVAPVFLLLLLGVHTSGRLYQTRLGLSILEDLPRLTGRWLATLGILLVLAPALGADRRQVIAFCVVAVLAVMGLRALSYSTVRQLRATQFVAHPTLIVGASRTGRHVATILREHPEYGLCPRGFLEAPSGRRDGLPLPVLGAPAEMVQVMEAADIRVAVLAHGRCTESELVQWVRGCHRQRCEIFVVPRLHELQPLSDQMEIVWDTPLIRLHRAAHRTVAWRVKRLVDLAAAAAALVVLSPLMAAVALAVRLETGPGVIFRQERIGIDGRRFLLLKFRSLRPLDATESATTWNIADDERLGPVGRFLRTTSLDELPQLVNILRGDMSVVGPRPERPYFVQEYGDLYPGYVQRHRVPCGLTGWAQVHGLRGDTSIEDRAAFDNFYIENWSLWLDACVILKTVVALVKSPGR